jgi:DDE_Tnp_1-associated
VQSLIAVFREVRDPRDGNARHDLAAMLFVALAATLCGAKTCVDIADFAAANEGELSQIVDLPHGAPSHDSFSRLFRLLDPEEMTAAFARFQTALRAEPGLPPAKGVVAVDSRPNARSRSSARIGAWKNKIVADAEHVPRVRPCPHPTMSSLISILSQPI